MEPRIGWTLLSRDALRRAETQLRDDVLGVRDEIGFLGLHQAYADRFFPGTSVLHTRLRYVLFVPWLYQTLVERGQRSQIAAAIEKAEIALAGRLNQSHEIGVIGGLSYPQPTTQPPSMVYWTALGTWRVLRPLPNGTYPSRRSVHRSIASFSTHSSLQDDDKQLLEESRPLFASIPSAPQGWADADAPLDFTLRSSERAFLRATLISVSRPGEENAPSLLSALVEQGVQLNDRHSLWSSRVRKVADAADRAALERSRRVAALSAIGRGVYAALVEQMRAKHDGTPTESRHRTLLAEIVDEFHDDAAAVDLEEVRQDSPAIKDGILGVLRATQEWLGHATRGPAELHPVYEQAESRRKGRRARLSRNLAGRERRLEWSAEEHPRATPLHFRWNNVRQLVIDLNGEA